MDHPSNAKCGDVWLYYKCLLPLKVIDVSYLQECINFEVKIGVKTFKFENFIKNLELNLEHIASKSPFLITVLGNFNVGM